MYKNVLLSALKYTIAKDSNLSIYLVDMRTADIVKIHYILAILLFLSLTTLINLSLKKLDLLYI